MLQAAGEWIGLSALVSVLLFVDLKLAGKGRQGMTVKIALIWSAIWLVVACLFNLVLLVALGNGPAFEYLTGFVIERSLSVDNLFVFLVIFGFFAVPPSIQPNALTWGIIGALVMRLVFILLGAALIEAFHPVIFVFGGLLIFTALRLLKEGETEVHPERNLMLRGLRLVMPISAEFHGTKFFITENLRRTATPFLVTMLVLASTDLVFALDSIPAIFAITEDPFIVYSSNAFAVLGLRPLFFALVGVMEYFVYLRQALVAILFFVGAKMIASEWYELPVVASLGYVAMVLAIAVGASIIAKKISEGNELHAPPGHP